MFLVNFMDESTIFEALKKPFRGLLKLILVRSVNSRRIVVVGAALVVAAIVAVL